MKRSAGQAKTVEAYIAEAPAKARPMLRLLRRTIRAAAPKAVEKISYRIPYYHYCGRLIYFAAYQHHVSLYVMGRGRRMFAKELKRYKTSEATYQIPIGSAIPVTLVKKVVRARVAENEAGLKK